MRRIDRRLEKTGKSRRAASIAAGLNPEYLRNLDEDESSPSIRALKKLAPVLLTTVSWLADESGPESPDEAAENAERVPVWGHVGAGGRIERFEVDSGPTDYIPTRDGWGPKTAAVQIKGESLGRLFDRWYAIYDEVRDPPTDDLIGELCICETGDGMIYIKRLKKFRGKKWTLESNVDAPIPDVTIKWAAKVKSIVPR